ncbi:MAG: DNA alkylation repair protein [Burkholderiales bacterium]|nr:DNA alkylation repair protein [Burkholderiales bacterium]
MMTEFQTAIQNALSPMADPARAPAMRAYMRDHFPFLGIPTPTRRAACKALLKVAPPSPHQLLERAYTLWDMPEREYQYVAIDLLARHWKILSVADLPALLTLASSKSWWDSVDGLAGVVGDLVRRASNDATTLAPALGHMEQALHHPDCWRRRIAMLHQLGWGMATDSARLFAYARTLAHEEEFFIRKAIGWALRDYAWHAPDTVRAFLLEMGTALSPLTRREAGKHLG